MRFIFIALFLSGCAGTSLVGTVSKGTVNELIHESSLFEQVSYRLQNVEKMGHENRKELELHVEHLHEMNKMISNRLDELKDEVKKVHELEEEILRVLRKHKIVSLKEGTY